MPNSYEQKQQQKKEGLLAAAAKRRAASDSLYTAGREALSAIPFGQPILVGHHSEKGDRAYRGRAVGKIDKSFALAKEADDLEARAGSVGTGGISSDDPDAIEKLKLRRDELCAAHESMLSMNRQARKAGKPAPFPGYQLTNSNANIARIQKRVRVLEEARTAPVWGPFVGPGWLAEEHKDDNRIVFKFREIPSEEVRALLRSRAFLWSPSRGLWIRKTTGNAKFAAEQVIAKLKTIYG